MKHVQCSVSSPPAKQQVGVHFFRSLRSRNCSLCLQPSKLRCFWFVSSLVLSAV